MTVPPHIAQGCLIPPSMMTRVKATLGVMTVLIIIILSVTLTHCNMSTIAWVGIGLLVVILFVMVWSSSTDGVLFKRVLKNCRETNEYRAQRSALMTANPSMSEADAGLEAERIMEEAKREARAAKEAAKRAARQAKLARAASRRRKS